MVAHTSCLGSHWQALRWAAAQTGSNQPSGFASPWRCSSQPARKLLFSPSPTSSENPSSQMCPSITIRAASLLWPFWGRWLVSPGEPLIASCWWHAVRGGEAPGCRALLQLDGNGTPRPCSLAPWTQGCPAYVQKKICSFRTKVPCYQFEFDLEKL